MSASLIGAAFLAANVRAQSSILLRQSNGLIGLHMKTIGAAIAAASPNDVINVAPGTYKEALTAIGMPLSLIGADATTVIIDATGLGVGIYVDSNDNKGLSGVFISGFTVSRTPTTKGSC